ARLREDNLRVMQANQRITAELHASVLELRMAQRTLRENVSKWENYERQVTTILVRADGQQDMRNEMVNQLREALARDLAREPSKLTDEIRDEANLQHAHLETVIFLHYYLLGQGVDPTSLSSVPKDDSPPVNPFVQPPQNEGTDK